MKATGRVALALALGLCATAEAVELPAGDEPLRLDITTTTIGAWHSANGNRTGCDDNFGEALERLNVNGSRGSWVLGLRLDGSLFPAPPQVSELPGTSLPCHAVELKGRYQNALVPEKLWLGWNGRALEVTVGDSYVSFGRGLSLSLRKTDELGLDTTQRGARVKLHTERLFGTLVGGVTNIGNLDEASGRTAPDPNDLVVGAEGAVRLFERVRVGAHAAGFAFHQPVSSYAPPGTDQTFAERWLNAGPTIDAPRLTEWLGIYLEGLGQRRTHVDGSIERGYGLYGTATAHLGAATVLFEGKSYGDLAVVQPRFDTLEFQAVQYASPPTVERVLQPLEHSQRHISGGRLRFDWTASSEMSVYLNEGLFRDEEGYLDPESVEVLPGTIHDPYAGVDARWGQLRLQAEVGWRGVFLPGAGAAVRSDGHGDLGIVRGFEGGSSLEVHAVHWERTKLLPFSSEVWREGTLQLGYRRRPWFAVNAILDYTTEAGQPGVWYPGATGEWDFTESSNVRLFVGASRGGLRCVSGVCRVFPPFQGAKATLTLRF